MNILNVTPEGFNEMKYLEYDTSMLLTYIFLKFGYLCGSYKVVVRDDPILFKRCREV